MARKSGMRRPPPDQQVRAREHEKEVMELRLRGQTWDTIAEHLHLTRRGAQKAWDRGLARIQVPHPLEAKLELIEQCRRVQAQLWITMSATTDAMEIAALSGRLLQAQQRMSALTGSDVPAQLALQIAQSAGPSAAEQLSVEELKSLPVEDLQMLSSIMARAKSGAPAPQSHLAIETRASAPAALPQPEPARVLRPAPPMFDDEPTEVRVAPAAIVVDPPPREREVMPTARQVFTRQRSQWNHQIDLLVNEMSMRCSGDDDPNTPIYRARIERLERLRDLQGDRNASRQA